jgi:hypothetical protein
VVIDVGPKDTKERRRDKRKFPIEGSAPTHTEPQWLLDKKGRPSIRLIARDHLGQQPNVAILLKERLELPSRHRLRDLPSPLRFVSLSAWALLLPLRNPEQARSAFSPWGLRPISERDLRGKRPSPGERQPRWPTIVAWGLVLGFFLEIVLAVLFSH